MESAVGLNIGIRCSPSSESGTGCYVEDFVALLDHLGIDRCHVLGFSLGGIIAQAIALVYPARVDRLVLCSTIAGVGPRTRPS